MGNLGNQYAELGETMRAIEHYPQAMNIFRDLKDRSSEAALLCNLGSRYADLGQTTQALQCLNDSLAIAQETGYRLIEGGAQTFLGHLYLDQCKWEQAVRAFKQAVEIADDTANVQFQQLARLGLAEANLYQNELSMALQMAEAAQQYDYPLENHSAPAISGIVALRQGDRARARDAFTAALNQASELLSKSPQLFFALDTKALALCGLALCENPSHIPAAKEAYRAARALTSAPGIVARVLRLFDALAQADAAAILVSVRPYAAGETAASAST